MRRWSVLFSVLLGMSLGGCNGCGKEEPTDGPQVEEFELSEHAKEWAKKVEKARAGEAVDFFDNGSTYRRWTGADGVRYSETRTSEGKVRSTFERRPDGYYKSTYSAYADGIIDNEIQRRPGEEVQLYDRNRAGFFNERLTLITIPETGMIHRTLATRASKTEDWKTIKDSIVPPSAGRPKSDFKNLKKNTNERLETTLALSKAVEPEWISGTSVTEIGNGQVLWDAGYNIVVRGSGAGELFNGKPQCDLGDAIKIRNALEFMISLNVQSCLANTNPDAADKLQEVMVELEKSHEVQIDCEVSDLSPYTAIADTRRTPGWDHCKLGTPCSISFNKADLKDMNETTLQDVLIHELLHVVGVPDDPETHNNGDDKIFSCARYCAGCSKATNGAPQHSSTDCARCADASEKKERCGHKVINPFGVPTGGVPECNIANFSTPERWTEVLCQSSRIGQYLFCDDTIWEAKTTSISGWSCCEECPCTGDCHVKTHNNNRLPCINSQGRPLPFPPGAEYNGCEQPPPFCSGK